MQLKVPSNKTLMTITLLISVVLLAAVLWQVDFSKLAIIAKNLKPSFFLLALITLPLEIFLKAARLKVMTETQSKITFTDSLVVTLIGLPLGMITPGRFGDFIKLDALSRRASLSLAKSFSIGVMEKALDFLSLFLLAAIGASILIMKNGGEIIFFYILTFAAATAAAVIVFLNKNSATRFFRFLFEKLVSGKHKNSSDARNISLNNIKDGFDDFYSGISAVLEGKISLTLSTVFAFLLWLNRILRIFLIAISLNLKAHFIYLILIVPIIDVIEIIPISIMGLGTREFSYIFLLSNVGIGREESIVLSLMSFLSVVIPFSLVGYLATIIEYGKKQKVLK